MKKTTPWLICLFAVIFSAVACCSSRVLGTKKSFPIQVVEMVYHDGWKACGSITIQENREYTWVRKDIWAADAQEQVFHGIVPKTIVVHLLESSRDSTVWQDAENGRTYSYAIDDSRRDPPPAIKELVDWLHRRGEDEPGGPREARGSDLK